jgi:bla regulator protein blaR1
VTPAIVAHLWQSTLFAGAAWLVSVTLRTNRAQVRYWIWFTASAKFLIPFSLLVGIGTLMPHRAAAPTIPTELMAALQEFGQPLTLTTVAEHVAVPGAATNHSILGPATFAFWAGGFLAVTICWVLRWRRVHALRSSARLVSVPTGLTVPVPVLSAPDIIEPGVYGFLRPVLLLPEDIAERLSQAQLDAILAHEFCHVRRRDNLTATIHMAVQAIFWFHPLTWWIGARLVDERERACDEEVLRLGCEPSVYAEGILTVCKLYLSSPLAFVSGVTGSNLKTRIESIMRNRSTIGLSPWKGLLLGVAGMSTLIVPLVVGILNAPPVRAQEAADSQPKAGRKMSFDVASIRLCKDEPGLMGGGGEPTPGRVSTGCAPLADARSLGLIQRAYVRFAGGHANPLVIVPIEGGPAWIHSEFYEINAKADGRPSQEMMEGPMLQALLEDRFKLKIHRETREVPVYLLTVVKASKLRPFKEGSCTPNAVTFLPQTLAEGQRPCKALVAARRGSVDVEGATILEFSKLLNLALDRPVIDKTGLTARFDFHLEFAPDQATPRLVPGDDGATAADPGGAPSIFTALQEQLGLKLQPAKGPGEFLVIDHVERPSEN